MMGSIPASNGAKSKPPATFADSKTGMCGKTSPAAAIVNVDTTGSGSGSGVGVGDGLAAGLAEVVLRSVGGWLGEHPANRVKDNAPIRAGTNFARWSRGDRNDNFIAAS